MPPDNLSSLLSGHAFGTAVGANDGQCWSTRQSLDSYEPSSGGRDSTWAERPLQRGQQPWVCCLYMATLPHCFAALVHLACKIEILRSLHFTKCKEVFLVIRAGEFALLGW